jgi:DNA-binding beta-propeller fold protein YncE
MGSTNRVFGWVAVCAAVSLTAAGQARASVLYASNFNSNTITAYDLATGALLGTPVTAGPEANGFNGVLLLGGNFLVTGQLTNNVVEYGSNGALAMVFDSSNTAGLNSPQDLAIGPDGRLYVVSTANDQILTYDPSTGAFLGTFADLSSLGHLGPIGLAFGPSGNLYVTSFDNDFVVVLDGQTGAILSSTPGPPGTGFGPAAFGPDGGLYIAGIELNTSAGEFFRFDPSTDALSTFIPNGSGGLESPGGLAFGPGSALYVSNLSFDDNFNDTGSTILQFNAGTGAPIGTLVGPGKGLNIPFFIRIAEPVPEPSSTALVAIGGVLLCLGKRRWRR